MKVFAPAVVGTARERFPAIEAVGVPLFTFKKPNLAEVVAEFPIKTSKVSLMGERAPDVILQLLDPPAPQVPKVAAAPAPPDFTHSPLDPSEVPSFIPPELVIENLAIPEADAVNISWFSIWSKIASAFPVAP